MWRMVVACVLTFVGLIGAPARIGHAGSPATVTVSAVHGQFFANPTSDGKFTARITDTPLFEADYPLINFNPAPSQQACNPATTVNQDTRPFTDVVPRSDGSCDTIVAQGNGIQAGSGNYQSFDAVFTGSITTSAAGHVSLHITSDDGWILSMGKDGAGDAPNDVSGPHFGDSAPVTFNNYPPMAQSDRIQAPTPDLVVINLPGAGTYPFELDYAEGQGGEETLTMQATAGDATGEIKGAVLANGGSNTSPLAGAYVQACGGVSCWTAVTGLDGTYDILGVPPDTYTIRAFPPDGSLLLPGSDASIVVGDKSVVSAPDIVLRAPQPLISGTTVSPVLFTAPGGMPVLASSSTPTLTALAPAGGYFKVGIQDETGSSSDPATLNDANQQSGGQEVYSGQLGILAGQHGSFHLTLTYYGQSSPQAMGSEDVYMLPSGLVTDTSNHPLSLARVTLLRSANGTDLFTPVPPGSGLLAFANRKNPDATDPSGVFGWDAFAGTYKVKASLPGCHDAANALQPFALSAPLTVPLPGDFPTLRLDCSFAVTQATPGDTAITLNWAGRGVRAASFVSFTPDCHAGAADAQADASIGPPPRTVTLPGNVFTYTLTGLKNRVQYACRINAQPANGNAVRTAIVRVTPLPTPTLTTNPQGDLTVRRQSAVDLKVADAEPGAKRLDLRIIAGQGTACLPPQGKVEGALTCGSSSSGLSFTLGGKLLSEVKGHVSLVPGVYTITFQVTDELHQSAMHTVTLTVVDELPPVIQGPSTVSAVVGQAVSPVSLTATDPHNTVTLTMVPGNGVNTCSVGTPQQGKAPLTCAGQASGLSVAISKISGGMKATISGTDTLSPGTYTAVLQAGNGHSTAQHPFSIVSVPLPATIAPDPQSLTTFRTSPPNITLTDTVTFRDTLARIYTVRFTLIPTDGSSPISCSPVHITHPKPKVDSISCRLQNVPAGLYDVRAEVGGGHYAGRLDTVLAIGAQGWQPGAGLFTNPGTNHLASAGYLERKVNGTVVGWLLYVDNGASPVVMQGIDIAYQSTTGHTTSLVGDAMLNGAPIDPPYYSLGLTLSPRTSKPAEGIAIQLIDPGGHTAPGLSFAKAVPIDIPPP